jgi:hypothetical protein
MVVKATDKTGQLTKLKDCYIQINGSETIPMYVLPEISDQKSAAYSDEAVMGRSFPFKTFSNSENRTIGMTLHFVTINDRDYSSNSAFTNLHYLRLLESLVYPRGNVSGVPFLPPPICKLQCGELLGQGGVCAILKSYNVRFPTDVAWDTETYLPSKFDVETNWDVLYSTFDLPGQEQIMEFGS